QTAVDGVKEAFRDFKTRVIGQQGGVLLFNAQQKSGGERLVIRNTAQLLDHQANVVIVEMDTVFHRLLHGVPVCLLETLLCAGGDFQEAPILRVKALQNCCSSVEPVSAVTEDAPP
ncbi:MAG: hypothetical protein K0R86_2848, partial [Enterobacter kobei]|nr:hypothetical protein [Enterobacter kobei]